MLSQKYLDLFEMYGDTVVGQITHPKIISNENQIKKIPVKLISLMDEDSEELKKFYKNEFKQIALPKIKKNPDNAYIEELLTYELTQHLRIIGYAGVGKSTYINNNYSYHEYILTAYTRIAASQINGSTLSSMFKLGRVNENTVSKAIASMKKFNSQMVEHIQIVKGIVIDEFYTVPAAIVEKVDLICQVIRECKESFGGLQLILVGDHRQTESIDSAFINSELYNGLNIKEIILPEHAQMRLTSEYMTFCNLFRNSKLNKDKMIRLLENKKFAQEEVVNAYTVYYTNVEVNKRNKEGMENFEGNVIYTRGKIDYKKNCPIYLTSSHGPLCNGMMGFFRDKVGKNLIIEVDGQNHEVKPGQIDFVPGFAMTIHKCQSKTFPGVNIYLSKHSIIKERSKLIRLVYVALTRVRHFNTCYIHLY
jgi:hypothetical protein